VLIVHGRMDELLRHNKPVGRGLTRQTKNEMRRRERPIGPRSFELPMYVVPAADYSKANFLWTG